jgi:protein-L-isoaspartate(D-aspartate) O-methyltransferase
MADIAVAEIAVTSAPANADPSLAVDLDRQVADRDLGPLPGDPSAVDPIVFLAPDDPGRMMADRQLRPFGVFNDAILDAFDAVPRDRFVAKGLESVAYADKPLPCVATGRTLLAPLILGRLIQEAGVRATDTALDVAGGSGYSACVLGRLVKDVTALESEKLETPFALGDNVTRATGPLAAGAPQRAPYDVILINGVIETRPDALLTQLADGGRLVTLERRGAAVQGVRYDRIDGEVTRRTVFNASGPALPEFAAPAAFRF